jgi:two-component sensor histidine kinase
MQQTFSALVARTRALPTPMRYAGTLLIVACTFLLRRALDPALPDLPYLVSFIAILLCASIFNHGAGFVATALSGAFAAYFYLLPHQAFQVEALQNLTGLILFLAVGTAISVIIETLHRALADAQHAHAILEKSERARDLLLHEIRHRTRNDLMSLQGLLLLRARNTPSEEAQDGLREAAEHVRALARVHARLAPERALGGNAASVNTREFITGLCTDMELALAGDGLRPITLNVEAEPHTLDTERAVQLGLVLNETVTNALKYAFPRDRSGTVRVHFRRNEGEFVLTVADDGVGLLCAETTDLLATRRPGSGVGTRLLRALATQLRGAFTCRPNDDAIGTIAELHFPAEASGAGR